jgi:putative two-component system response regulator
MTSGRKTVFLVDDNEINLSAGKDMLKDRYTVYPMPSAEILFDVLEKVAPDMILLDIEMPGMNGYEAIRKLKEDPRRREIPVIFITAKADEGSELDGLSLGAADYITKPFSAPLLLKRIETHLISAEQKRQLRELNGNLEELVQQKTLKVLKLQNTILNTMADMVEFRDKVTGGHVCRTQAYLKILVNELLRRGIYAGEVSGWDLDHLIRSAQLHDLGKIAISDLILNKSDALSPAEFEEIKRHVEIGVQAIKKIEAEADEHEHSFLRLALRRASGHHEKWDGTGYPGGLKGEEIPLEARLMAIADVYDALISRRPYKEPLSANEARDYIIRGSGTQFDPALVEVFAGVADRFTGVVEEFAQNGALG